MSRWRPALAPCALVAASASFVLLNDVRAFGLLTASIVGNFLAHHLILGRAPGSRTRRGLTAVAITANLLPLVGFKLVQARLPWIIDPVSPDSATIAMPLGLAFYTLSQISFLVDIQRPDTERLGFARYAAWSSFFAQLPAGPISTWRGMAPQYARLGSVPPPRLGVARGLTLMLAGVVKKIWIAGPLAGVVDPIFSRAASDALNPIEAWTAAWGYMLQLYFDFSAYSDIAIGLGLCFGLTLPVNFNSPLKSRSPGQYIMRWHMSLMQFARDYIFEPMFRVARRLPIRPTPRRYAIGWAIATLVTFLAVAAWHTLAPLPLLEGLAVSATLIVIQFARLRRRAAPASHGRVMTWTGHVVSHAALLAALSIAAMFLRVDAAGQIGRLMSGLFDVPSLVAMLGRLLAYASGSIGPVVPGDRPVILHAMPYGQAFAFLVVGAASMVALTAPNTMQMFGMVAPGRTPPRLQWQPTAHWGFAAVALLYLGVLGITASTQKAFIYANF